MQSVQQLEQEVQRLKIAVEELSVLNDLAIAASSILEVKQMLDIIIQKSIKAVKAEQGSISLVTESDETPFRTLVRQVDRTHEQIPYRVGVHITGWVLKNKKPLMIENLAADQRFKASEQEQKEIRSVLCVPIWSQAKLIGILMMTMVKGILHSIVQQFSSAEHSLSEINSIIARIVPKEIFITMMFLIFDLNKKVLRFSNAGHNPIVYYASQIRSCQLVELKGCALNLLKKCSYAVKEIPFQSNDLFLIYTDGVTEATNESRELFEETRLIQAVEEAASESADTVISHVKSRLFAFTGKTKQADDVLMIAIKIT